MSDPDSIQLYRCYMMQPWWAPSRSSDKAGEKSPVPRYGEGFDRPSHPLLIVQRVANQGASTSATDRISSSHGRNRRESAGGGGTLSGRYPSDPMDEFGGRSSGLGVRLEITINLQRDGRI